MKRFAYLILLIHIAGCNNTNTNTLVSEEDCFLVDFKTFLVSYFKPMEAMASGKIENNGIHLKYYSISQEEFFSALERNKSTIRYFDREKKINEFKTLLRNGPLLKLTNCSEHIYLVDIQNDSNQKARNFFLEGMIGGFYIIKRNQFETFETILVNKKTLKEELYLRGVSASINLKDSLMLYSDPFYVIPGDNHRILLLGLSNNKIDTLLYAQIPWFTEFSFFDQLNNEIYYIHSFFENYNEKSTFAKMTYEKL